MAVISGGFGDAINQLAKAICLRDTLNIKHITYIRDTIDENILHNVKPLTKDYASWVETITIVNGFDFSLIAGDQKKLCETLGQNKENIILGPNMNYDIKIFEQQRGMYIGQRPNEYEFIPNTYVDFVKQTSFFKFDICIQVRFGSEYPTKVPNASWSSIEELVTLLKYLKEKGLNIALIGETKQNISALKNIVEHYAVNTSVLEQYNLLLSSPKAIVFSGFAANLCLLNNIQIMRMLWDELEFKLQTPLWAYNNLIHFNHENLWTQLETFLQK